MYKYLLVIPFLLVSCSSVTLQGTAPCNGRVVITKPARQFLRHTRYGTLRRIVHKPICTIPFKKGDRIDEDLTFCFLSGSELGIEIRREHYIIVNKHHHFYDELIGTADFVPNRTREINIGERQFTIHATDSADTDEHTNYQYHSNIEFMIKQNPPKS